MRFNIFKGARRASIVLALLAIGIAAWQALEEPYIPFSLSSGYPNVAWVPIEGSCDSSDASYLVGASMHGNVRFINLCFQGKAFPDGSVLVPYELKDGMLYGNDKYSPEVMQYARRVAENFTLSDEHKAAFDLKRSAVKEQIRKEIAKDLVGYLLAFWTVITVVGWIVRGLLGIPFGKDFAPRPSGETL